MKGKKLDMSMSGKTIIYGGSGGIGSATARLLHAKGQALHLVGRNTDALSLLANELSATYTVGDVTDSRLFSQVSDDLQATESVCDGLIYAVGSINLGSLTRLKETDFLNDFKVNAMGAALAVQAALPLLKKSSQKPSVLLFSSVAAVQGFSFHASVGMAKGAVNGLTLALAAELAPKIRVNAIAPSLTRTPLASNILANEQMVESLAKLHPLPRLGEAEEMAKLASFLVSEDADWITGQVISVDGGRSTLRNKG